MNQFAIINGPNLASSAPEDSIYILMGHVRPPLFTGPDDVERFIASKRRIDIDVRAEAFMTRERAEELWKFLGQALDKDRD